MEVYLDQSHSTELGSPILTEVKSRIVYAAIMIADYKLRHGQYALMDLGFSRGFAKPLLQQVQRLFPFEDAFASFNEIPESDVLFQTAFPNEGTELILGLRPVPRKARTDEEVFLNRLILMLDAFGGVSDREATFDADLVACWAAMCNLSYDYCKDDALQLALAKAIRAIRNRGVKVYNWVVSNRVVQDIDFRFFDYSKSHPQENATNRAFFPGLPVFTGHADTTLHFLHALSAVQWYLPQSSLGEAPVNLQRVYGAEIKLAVAMENVSNVLFAIRMAFSGKYDDMMFTNGLADIVRVLLSWPRQLLAQRTMIVARIPQSTSRKNQKYFNAWSICPSNVLRKGRSLFIAREKLNGTLVVAGRPEGSRNGTVIEAYLTISDHQCGTYLIPVDESGLIDIRLRTPQRSDMLNSNYMVDRELRASVVLLSSQYRSNDFPEASTRIVTSTKALNDWADRQPELEFPGNDEAIDNVNEESNFLLKRLAQLLSTRTGADMFNTGGVRGRTPLNIDIGHPQLVPQGQEQVDFRRSLRKRRAAEI